MEKLTRYEEAFLEAMLKKEKRNLEELLEKRPDSFEAFLAKDEGLPMLESLLKKFEN